MKLLFDQNLSDRLVGQLASEFPGSQHVRNAGFLRSREGTVEPGARQEPRPPGQAISSS
jgi:predicted nuclease of predicted toxin-antitoxin system